MQFLYLLERCRMPGLNEFMLLITNLGSETVFLVLALVTFWCLDKRAGYYLISIGVTGTTVSQFLKLMFRVPRPWVIDPNFTILEAARADAGGFSFPSGHTQDAVGTFGALALLLEKKWQKAICIAIAVVVPFSRMYLGVHTPLDVGVAAVLALILVFILRPVVYSKSQDAMKALFAVMIVLCLGFVLYAAYYPFPADVDPENMTHGLENACALFGALLAVAVSYVVDEKKTHFPVKAVWWAQILKILGGLAVTLAAKEGLKIPLNFLIPAPMAARFVRYFLTVLVAGTFWPMSFARFSRMGNPKESEK